MDSKNINLWDGWWRWPLVPIASIVGAFLGSAVFVVVQWLSMKFSGNYNESGWYFQYIVPLLRDGLYGFLTVYFGCLVAPRGKLIVGVVLTTLIAVVFFGMLFLKLNGMSDITIIGLISGVVVTIGGIIGVIQTYDGT